MRSALAASLLPLLVAAAVEGAAIAPFSGAVPGAAIPASWRAVTLPNRPPARFEIVPDEGRAVLQVVAQAAASTLVHTLDADTRANPMLSWRWKVDHALDGAKLGTEEGDDFAARVYVSFDLPLGSLPAVERAKVNLARLVFGEDVPAAAICYVWDNANPRGTSQWNPFAPRRVRMVVLQSGNARARAWVAETRDLEADFRAAFGIAAAAPVPRITGVAVGVDTDQTGESATAWFGDLTLAARP